jgi:hypothetical protein
MGANASMPILGANLEARAMEGKEKLIARLAQRFERVLREVFKGHGENYFDGY